MRTTEHVADWLTKKADSYRDDADTLSQMDDDELDDITPEQWSIVYQTISDELHKCATAVRDHR